MVLRLSLCAQFSSVGFFCLGCLEKVLRTWLVYARSDILNITLSHQVLERDATEAAYRVRIGYDYRGARKKKGGKKCADFRSTKKDFPFARWNRSENSQRIEPCVWDNQHWGMGRCAPGLFVFLFAAWRWGGRNDHRAFRHDTFFRTWWNYTTFTRRIPGLDRH